MPPPSLDNMLHMKRPGGVLIALGALLTAFVLGPVKLIEAGRLPALDSHYILLMWGPAGVPVVPLLCARCRGLGLPGVEGELLARVGIRTIPIWEPNLSP